MSEIEQLRADIATLEAAQATCQRRLALHTKGNLEKCVVELKERLADLEAAAADPWAKAKQVVEIYRCSFNDNQRLVAGYVEDLESKVAELEAELEGIPTVPDEKAYLDDFRVLKTACDIADYTLKNSHAREHEKHLAEAMIQAIHGFTLHARKWGGLKELEPYRWSSIGHGEDHLINRKQDTGEQK